MPELGYALSSEEHDANELTDLAVQAESVGLDFVMVSDHYHPWIDRQGESPFVWTTLGAVGRETEELRVGTGVTCPTIRVHPAVVAQAAATTADLFGDRFFLGVGTGERLNEHVLGDRWPSHDERLEMLEEAVDVMRELWTGELVSHRGDHYTVENAKLYTLPDEPPSVAVAASGSETATAAGRFGDALVATSPDEETVDAFDDAHEGDAPRYGQAAVCYAESEAAARRTVHEWWPNGALPGVLGQELPTPAVFEQAATLVDEADAVADIPHGPDADDFVASIQQYADAGYDHVYLHQIGPEQEPFLEFLAEEVLPSFS